MKKILGLIVVLIFACIMIRPLFASGYFPMHDDTQVARVVVMGRALRSGQFPVRWVSDLGYGYGYPIFNFYGPLPYYVGGFFYAAGLTGLTATKIMMGLGLVLAGVSMYAAVAAMTGIAAGVVAAILYMFAPYHAVQAYVRGAVGEYYTLIFLPLIVWGFWKVIREKSSVSGILLGAVGTAGLIVSHTILGYAGLVFEGAAVALAGAVWLKAKQLNIKAMLWLMLLGLGISAFFWLPAIMEMKYTNVASQVSQTADFHDHFVCVGQLWNSIWGFGGSAQGCLDGLSFKIGKVHLLGALAALAAMSFGFIRDKRIRTLIVAGAGIFGLSVFFMLPVSRPVWEIIPLFSYVQYPWRFLAFAVFGISVVVGQAVYVFRARIFRFTTAALLIGLVIAVESKRFVPQYTYDRPAGDFETREEIRFRVSRISDEYLPPDVPRPQKPEEVISDTIAQSPLYTMELQQQSDTYGKFRFDTRTGAPVKINTAYFPGWRYIVNVTEATPVVENGLPVINIPKEDSVLQMRFKNTPVRAIGNTISLLSLAAWLYLYDKHKKTVS